MTACRWWHAASPANAPLDLSMDAGNRLLNASASPANAPADPSMDARLSDARNKAEYYVASLVKDCQAIAVFFDEPALPFSEGLHYSLDMCCGSPSAAERPDKCSLLPQAEERPGSYSLSNGPLNAWLKDRDSSPSSTKRGQDCQPFDCRTWGSSPGQLFDAVDSSTVFESTPGSTSASSHRGAPLALPSIAMLQQATCCLSMPHPAKSLPKDSLAGQRADYTSDAMRSSTQRCPGQNTPSLGSQLRRSPAGSDDLSGAVRLPAATVSHSSGWKPTSTKPSAMRWPPEAVRAKDAAGQPKASRAGAGRGSGAADSRLPRPTRPIAAAKQSPKANGPVVAGGSGHGSRRPSGKHTSSFEKWIHEPAHRHEEEHLPNETDTQNPMSASLKDDLKDIFQDRGRDTLQVSKLREQGWQMRRRARDLKLPLDDVLILKRVFDSLDHDKSGALDFSEFEVAVTRLVEIMQLPTANVEAMSDWCYWDPERMKSAQGIDFDEFLKWYASNSFKEDLLLTSDQQEARSLAKRHGLYCDYVDEMKKYFDEVTNYTQETSFEEFGPFLHKVLKVPAGCEIPENRIRYFWTQIDEDCSGKVVFEEFFEWWMRNFSDKNSGTEQQPYERFYQQVRRLGADYLDPLLDRNGNQVHKHNCGEGEHASEADQKEIVYVRLSELLLAAAKEKEAPSPICQPPKSPRPSLRERVGSAESSSVWGSSEEESTPDGSPLRGTIGG